MYFANKDSYKSASSGILTILSGLGLVVLFLYIFVPIYFKVKYISEMKLFKTTFDFYGKVMTGDDF